MHDYPQVPLNVAYEGLAFNGDAAQAVNIDLDDLMGESLRHPGLVVFWGSLAGAAAFDTAAAKQLRNTTRAQRFEHHRTALLTQGEKATEAAINARCEQDDAVLSAEAQYNAAQETEAKVKAVYEAVRSRKDLITSVTRLATASGEDVVRDYTPKPSPAAARRRPGK